MGGGGGRGDCTPPQFSRVVQYTQNELNHLRMDSIGQTRSDVTRD